MAGALAVPEVRDVASKAVKETLPTLGKYELLEEIAEGGMGTVYKGRHQDDGAIVAIKVIAPELAGNEVLLKRFELEYQTARKLDHPHIVRALDFGRHGTSTYLVMEYVDGPTLGARIEREGRIPEDDAIRIISQVGEALHEAHEHGILHRDVKPDNILITSAGQAKLTDLGLVKNLQADLGLTRPGRGLGTPNFMAPEQLRNAKGVDARCDVYALAATLYMAVTGELPFDTHGSVSALFKKKFNNEIAQPRQVVPSLSARVDAAIRRAMSVDPGQRPASCREFVRELTAGASKPQSVPALRLARTGGAEAKPKKSVPMERRATLRFPSSVTGMCRSIAGEKRFRWSAKVQNISVAGLCLLVSRRFEPGAVLLVDLPPDKVGDGPSRLLVRVVRVEARPPRKWIIGCVFGPSLSEAELRALRDDRPRGA